MAFYLKLNTHQSAHILLVERWLIEEGQFVDFGRPILMVRADQEQVPIRAEEKGILLAKHVQNGESFDKESTLATIVTPEEAGEIRINGKLSFKDRKILSALNQDHKRHFRMADHLRVTPAARTLADEYGINLSEVKATGPNGRIQRKDVYRYLDQSRAQVSSNALTHERLDMKLSDLVSDNVELKEAPKELERPVRVSPLARRIAEAQGIDLSKIEPKNHRIITKQDLMTYLDKEKPSLQETVPQKAASEEKQSFTGVFAAMDTCAEVLEPLKEKSSEFQADEGAYLDEVDMNVPEEFEFQGLSYNDLSQRDLLMNMSIADLMGLEDEKQERSEENSDDVQKPEIETALLPEEMVVLEISDVAEDMKALDTEEKSEPEPAKDREAIQEASWEPFTEGIEAEDDDVLSDTALGILRVQLKLDKLEKLIRQMRGRKSVQNIDLNDCLLLAALVSYHKSFGKKAERIDYLRLRDNEEYCLDLRNASEDLNGLRSAKKQAAGPKSSFAFASAEGTPIESFENIFSAHAPMVLNIGCVLQRARFFKAQFRSSNVANLSLSYQPEYLSRKQALTFLEHMTDCLDHPAVFLLDAEDQRGN